MENASTEKKRGKEPTMMGSTEGFKTKSAKPELIGNVEKGKKGGGAKKEKEERAVETRRGE